MEADDTDTPVIPGFADSAEPARGGHQQRRLVQWIYRVTSPGWPRSCAIPTASRDATVVRGTTPGLWYSGLRWLTRRRSAFLFGFPDDAETIANGVKTHLEQQSRP